MVADKPVGQRRRSAVQRAAVTDTKMSPARSTAILHGAQCSWIDDLDHASVQRRCPGHRSFTHWNESHTVSRNDERRPSPTRIPHLDGRMAEQMPAAW
jgi:hypothetical protein